MRLVFEMIADTIIHEGDMFGIISSGKSSIAVPMTLDRARLDEAMGKMLGEALSANDTVRVNQSNSALQEIRWRAHSAFKTAMETIRNLEEVQNRRKVFLYLSSGYHFDPFGDARTIARFRSMEDSGLFEGRRGLEDAPTLPHFNDPALDQIDESANMGSVFSDAELQLELLQLTSAANRANVSFYTVDPRGLLNTMDMDTNAALRQREFNEHTTAQRNSLRMLAELTGGMAVVNRNNFEDAFREIDAETSSYYVLGFYSSNTNPTHRTRRLNVGVDRDGAEVRSRTYYSLPFAPAAASR
jgi:VWFA-related protein